MFRALKDEKHPVFTPQADVYRYAMTCYETLTGNIPFPFPEYRASDYDMVLNGERPKLPSKPKSENEDLMNRCWHQDPQMRPSFDEIVEELRGLHRELIRGSEDASTFMDEIFDISGAGLEPTLDLVWRR